MFKGIIYFYTTACEYNKKYIVCLYIKEVLNVILSLSVLVIPRYIIDSVFIDSCFFI